MLASAPIALEGPANGRHLSKAPSRKPVEQKPVCLWRPSTCLSTALSLSASFWKPIADNGSICARHGAASRQCSFSSLDHAHWRTLELGSSRRCGESTLKNRVNARGRYKLQHKGGCSGGNGHSQANAMNFEKCIQPSVLPTTRKRTSTEIRCQKLVTRNLMARAPNDWRALRGIDPKRIAIAAFQCKADK